MLVLCAAKPVLWGLRDQAHSTNVAFNEANWSLPGFTFLSICARVHRHVCNRFRMGSPPGAINTNQVATVSLKSHITELVDGLRNNSGISAFFFNVKVVVLSKLWSLMTADGCLANGWMHALICGCFIIGNWCGCSSDYCRGCVSIHLVFIYVVMFVWPPPRLTWTP